VGIPHGGVAPLAGIKGAGRAVSTSAGRPWNLLSDRPQGVALGCCTGTFPSRGISYWGLYRGLGLDCPVTPDRSPGPRDHEGRLVEINPPQSGAGCGTADTALSHRRPTARSAARCSGGQPLEHEPTRAAAAPPPQTPTSRLRGQRTCERFATFTRSSRAEGQAASVIVQSARTGWGVSACELQGATGELGLLHCHGVTAAARAARAGDQQGLNGAVGGHQGGSVIAGTMDRAAGPQRANAAPAPGSSPMTPTRFGGLDYQRWPPALLCARADLC